jgi:hypothetical protein
MRITQNGESISSTSENNINIINELKVECEKVLQKIRHLKNSIYFYFFQIILIEGWQIFIGDLSMIIKYYLAIISIMALVTFYLYISSIWKLLFKYYLKNF